MGTVRISLEAEVAKTGKPAHDAAAALEAVAARLRASSFYATAEHVPVPGGDAVYQLSVETEAPAEEPAGE